jgi:hypothetical protein
MRAHRGAKRYHFSDFTEICYRQLVRSARERYRFERFGSSTNEPHVLWRHDVDLSIHRALRIAEIERKLGVRSTFFLLPHSEFYNLLERAIAVRVRQIAALGHDIGLHFDPSFYGPGLGTRGLEKKLAREKRLLEDLSGTAVRAFSLHDPKPAVVRALSRDRIAGMINVYGAKITTQYQYCSDSNGFWRHRRLADLIAHGGHPRLHVLTHPEWWVPAPMSPWKRMQRCVSGRADYVVQLYNRSLSKDNRLNLGKPK